jgi:hypothetical protein
VAGVLVVPCVLVAMVFAMRRIFRVRPVSRVRRRAGPGHCLRGCLVRSMLVDTSRGRLDGGSPGRVPRNGALAVTFVLVLSHLASGSLSICERTTAAALTAYPAVEP